MEVNKLEREQEKTTAKLFAFCTYFHQVEGPAARNFIFISGLSPARLYDMIEQVCLKSKGKNIMENAIKVTN